MNQHGMISVVQQANPAVATDWTYTHPASAKPAWLVTGRALYTADANAANRQVRFTVKDAAGNIIGTYEATANITANQVMSLCFSNGLLSSLTGISGLCLQIGLPLRLMLLPGYTIGPVTANKQAGDQWSAIWMELEQTP